MQIGTLFNYQIATLFNYQYAILIASSDTPGVPAMTASAVRGAIHQKAFFSPAPAVVSLKFIPKLYITKLQISVDNSILLLVGIPPP